MKAFLSSILIISFVFTAVAVVSLAEAALPFFTANNTYQGSTLENDNSFIYSGSSNVSFEINASDTDKDLANATFEFDAINYTATLQDGLQGWYKFNEERRVGSKVLDYSKNGFDGSLSNIPKVTWASNSSGAATGKFGDALYFKNNRGGVAASPGFATLGGANLRFNITNQFTISFWTLYNSSSAWFLSKRAGFGGSCNFRTISMTTTGSNLTQFIIGTTGSDGVNCNGTTVTSANNLLGDQWYHIAATYNNTYMVLYFNGTQQGIAYKTGDLNFTSDTWKIANLDGNNGAFNGTIDDFRIYNRSLSQTEVKELWEEGNGGGTIGRVYQISDGNYSSRFFINVSPPSSGLHNFKWYAADFANGQNKSENLFLSILGHTIQTGCYLSSAISDFYLCSYDNTEFSPAKAFGIIYSGDTSSFRKLCNDDANENYKFNMSALGPMRFVMPFTNAVCTDFGNKTDAIKKQNLPSTIFGDVSVQGSPRFHLRLQYERILINGTARFGEGTHTICIEKTGRQGQNALVNIREC